MFAAFLATILFSISAVTANRSVALVGGTTANFWRLCVATLLLGIYAHGWGVGWDGPAFGIFLLSGAAGFGVGDLALFQALPRLGSRLTILLVHCLAAPLAAAVEWIWLGTTLHGREMAASALILTGVAVALIPDDRRMLRRGAVGMGVAFGVLAAAGQGMGAVLSRVANEVTRQAGATVDGMNAAYQRILAGVAVSGVFLLLVRWRAGAASWREGGPIDGPAVPAAGRFRRAAPWIALNALAGPTLGVSCYQWALLERGTGVVLPMVAITPLVVIPFAAAMEGERPTVRSIVGGLIAVAGAVWLAAA